MPDIVVDVGCARYGDDYSIERLVEELHPHTLFGFDPNAPAHADADGDTDVIVSSAAAWTHDGAIGYGNPGLCGFLTTADDAQQVPCIDLARFIVDLPAGETIALKIDAEGAEYELLEHLIATGADRRLTLAWVEWHDPQGARALIEERLRCDLREWAW